MSSVPPSLRETLTSMPGMTAGAWRRMSGLRRYLISVRAGVLPLTLYSCLLGGLLALPWKPAEGWRLALVTVALLFAHAAGNLLNDQVDWLLGSDRATLRLRYGPHPLAQGLIHPLSHGLWLIVTAAVAVLLGLLVCRFSGPAVYWLATAGGLLLMFYAWPLKRLGLGELAVLLVWGPLLVGGVYWIVSGDWGPEIAMLSLLAGLGPAVLVLARHTDQIRDHRDRGARTLPVRLGATRSARLLAGLAVLQMVGLTAWAWQTTSWSYLLILGALPAALALVRICMKPRPTARPKGFPTQVWPLWYTPVAFRFARASGLALVAAALLDGL